MHKRNSTSDMLTLNPNLVVMSLNIINKDNYIYSSTTFSSTLSFFLSPSSLSVTMHVHTCMSTHARVHALTHILQTVFSDSGDTYQSVNFKSTQFSILRSTPLAELYAVNFHTF